MNKSTSAGRAPFGLRGMRWSGRLARIAAVAVAVMSGVGGFATVAGATPPSGLVVSSPAGPVSVVAGGGPASTYVRVGNNTARPLTVDVAVGTVSFGDDGHAWECQKLCVRG